MNYYLLLLGVVGLAGGSALLLQARKIERFGYHTLGEIIDVIGDHNKAGSKYKYTYYPVIRITTANGAIVDRKMDVGTSPSAWTIGKKMNVIYFDEKIHPTGWGWTLLYGFFAIAGGGVLLYQLISFFS